VHCKCELAVRNERLLVILPVQITFMTLAFSMMNFPSLYFWLSSNACSYFQPRTVLHDVQ